MMYASYHRSWLDAIFPINIFVLVWSSITITVGMLGFVVLFYEHRLPKRLVNMYKYGKLLPNDRSLTYTGETLMECIRDLFHGEVRQVPKRWFVDFYVFAIIYHSILFKIVWLFCPSQKCTLLVYILDILFGRRGGYTYSVNEAAAVIVFGLAMFHYCRRCYETCFVSIFSDTTIGIFQYLVGFAFYGSVGLTFTNLLVPTRRALPLDISFDYLAIGLILYIVGSVVQYQSHARMAQQRKRIRSDGTEEVTMDHIIPHGGLFEYVSCPHYFAEILIYTGFYFVTHFDNSFLSLLVWVIVNQITCALMSHAWYREKFGASYPRHRRAIIPYLL